MSSSQSLPFLEFLGSEIVELCTTARPDSMKIHQKLLESKCGASAAALKHNFKERTSMRMTFQETRYETVAQFVEWAYSGDYTEVVPLPFQTTPDKKSEPLPESSSSESLVKTPLDESSKGVDLMESPPDSSLDGSQAHTLLIHLRVYIFSDIYLISELKELAFTKFTTVVRAMGKPNSMKDQLAILDCLDLTFTKVPLHDKLPGWLAYHAAWCMDKLRLQTKFHDLLHELPGLASRMMDSLNPASCAPWEMQPAAYSAPSYDARGAFRY